jgi:hypothetical protein
LQLSSVETPAKRWIEPFPPAGKDFITRLALRPPRVTALLLAAGIACLPALAVMS